MLKKYEKLDSKCSSVHDREFWHLVRLFALTLSTYVDMARKGRYGQAV